MIRFKLLTALLLLAVTATPALAEIKLAIEEPSGDKTRSGIGLISGWAISDRGVDSVEAFIDENSLGKLPYGSSRADVANAFPTYPDAEQSGWAMKWNFSILDEGEHILTVVVTEKGGGQLEKEVIFNVTGFESEFISDPEDVRTSNVMIESPEDGRFIVTGALVEGKVVNFELVWDTASQQFMIDRIEYSGEEKELLPPRVNAGSNKVVEPGESVVINGSGSDPDGNISSLTWSQVSGPEVSLAVSNYWTVRFTAPETASTIRLRLTAVDDDGLSDSDDVVIEVKEAAPPPNQAPTAAAGPNFAVQTGQEASINGEASDSDGEIVKWAWTRVSGLAVSLQNADSPTVRFVAPGDAGQFRLRLTVTDDDGATAYDDVVVTVESNEPPPNQAPTADAGRDKTANTGDNVSIRGEGSDSDGEIVSWSWTQISGTTVQLSGSGFREVQFTAPDDPTEIRLRLTVTDDDGASDTDDVIITVEGSTGGTDNTTGETLSSMLPFINDARGEARLCGDTEYPAQPPLNWSSSLAEIAMLHSMDMARQGYFSHTSKDGTSMGDRVFPYWIGSGNRVGENIAASSVDRPDEYIVQLWLDSPGHCALIMDPNFTHAGVGAGHDEDNGYKYSHFWTLDFGG